MDNDKETTDPKKIMTEIHNFIENFMIETIS